MVFCSYGTCSDGQLGAEGEILVPFTRETAGVVVGPHLGADDLCQSLASVYIVGMDDDPASCPLDVPQANLGAVRSSLCRLDLFADPGDETFLGLGLANVGLGGDIWMAADDQP